MLDFMSATKSDLSFSLNGDFTIRHGDLEDTLSISGLGFVEEVELRVKSSRGDWYFHREKGADLALFEGRMITPALLENIKESIIYSLTYDDFLSTSSFKVDATIIDIGEVAVKIVFSDNIRKLVDYKIQDVRIVFDLSNGTPRFVR